MSSHRELAVRITRRSRPRMRSVVSAVAEGMMIGRSGRELEAAAPEIVHL